MTAALSPSTASMPTAATPNPLAALTGRVKRLDPNEFMAVANEVAAQQQAVAEQLSQTSTGTFTPAGVTGTSGVSAEQRAALEAQLAQAQEQQQALKAQQQALAAQAERTENARPTTATAAPTTTTTEAAAPTTQAAQASSGAVAIPSSNVAPRTEHDYWTKHIAQFAGKYLPDGPSMRPNCGPASVTMALRMIGLDIPGFSGQNSEAVLDKARILATGKNDTSVGTTDSELETLIGKSGGQWSESNNFEEIKGWVKQGIPVVLSGNPAHGWNSRYSADQVQPFDGGHWVTVSGYDNATGHYIVNDPLSQVGPIYVSEAELASYNQAHGKLGIAVFR